MNDAVWLALWLPRLSTDRLQRGTNESAAPLVVYAKRKNAYVLTGVDARASGLGLKRAMSLADARAMQPSLVAAEADAAADARTLDRIAAWCERFTPVTVVDPPDGLFLDISGCGHLFGGDDALKRELLTRLRAQGFAARAALGPTPGAAWALARYGANTENTDTIERMLAPLPVEALRLQEDAAALLRRLGLKTIGQLVGAPRAPLAARAGQNALLRLDWALGRAPEPLSPRRPPPPVFALRRFLEPLFSVETILVATERLCGDIVEKLDTRGLGARRCVLHLFGVDGRDREIAIGLSRPERDVKTLVRLFREKLNLAAENLDAEFGIEAARLDAAHVQRIDNAPRTLAAIEDKNASAEQVAALADILSARLGPERVLRPLFVAAHRPERAGRWRSALASPQEAETRNEDAARRQTSPPPDSVMRRPLTLFAAPQPIDAVAAVPDGPPIRFRWRRVLREVARAEGPERIGGGWMSGGPARDYYRVEDAQGRRYWLYREGLYGESEAPRWFMHGLFA